MTEEPSRRKRRMDQVLNDGLRKLAGARGSVSVGTEPGTPGSLTGNHALNLQISKEEEPRHPGSFLGCF